MPMRCQGVDALFANRIRVGGNCVHGNNFITVAAPWESIND